MNLVQTLQFCCYKKEKVAMCQWLTPIILATQETAIKGLSPGSKSAPSKQIARPSLENTHYKTD
jgi:hypothetical protein